MELSDSFSEDVGAYISASLPLFEQNAFHESIAQNWLNILYQQRAIAVIRASTLSTGHHMADAVIAGGMQLIEVTWNSDRPADLVRRLRAEYPHCWVGAGTILTWDDLQDAIAAGAQFLFSPHTHPDLIQEAVRCQIPVIPGALSPTEITTAWQAGATCVKVFPANVVGGAEYLKSLQGPLGHIPLIPTGGITLENATKYLQAGAIALGLAGSLFPAEAIATENWTLITQRAMALMQRIHPFLA
ncbi:MAG: bifunctional 4-hydroxy-2-oxoglutarate aldolase/2-dehydro-3-deoxy-phosphogluconate aldolase [Synechococcales cyanobacterium T60_A2020_003]|nr:bifunctional 4-hydroxy-2-oxoglutarate aldolase/2-dehydro-3-deoxy-phosphogluconate aldolase [Synechococcales cyanobacterium T60_A2020_003]